jgi:predicted RNA binding protein YcfA (HicA-like mRNA interferase family)
MTSRELLRRLRRLGARIVTDRGKGGHVMVEWNGRVTYVPTGSGELRTGTFQAILKALDIPPDRL